MANTGSRADHEDPRVEDKAIPRLVPDKKAQKTETCVTLFSMMAGLWTAVRIKRSPNTGSSCHSYVPTIEVMMDCDPDLAVMSARFSRMAKELWIAARDALEDR